MMALGFCSPRLTFDIATEIVDEKSEIVELTSHWSTDSLGHPV
jgi:hypothetical protein